MTLKIIRKYSGARYRWELWEHGIRKEYNFAMTRWGCRLEAKRYLSRLNQKPEHIVSEEEL